jgi:hypothetical protein
MTKKERLDKIEEQYENFVIDCFANNKTDKLPEVASIGNYLAKNSKVAEKEKSTLEDEQKIRLKQAEERRSKNDK